MTKEEARNFLEKLGVDEPVFILRGQDALAPEIVREWAYRARKMKVSQNKVSGARLVASQMEDWQQDFDTKKIPD